MTDIVGRLGASIVLNEWGRIDKALRDDTIAEIERLRARLAEAVEVMRETETLLSSSFKANIIDSAEDHVLRRARAFLAKVEG